MGKTSEPVRVAVVGGGPGGYAAAFMAADLGMRVTLIDSEANPGGVCLYRGCIPSKALLHAAKVIAESQQAAEWGIEFSKPEIRIERMRAWKDGIVEKLTGGLGGLCRQRKIRYIRGSAVFSDSTTLEVHRESGDNEQVAFDKAILATGSLPVRLPGISDLSPRVWDSRDALDLTEIPESLLIIGGGYIGLELGTVYAALGSRITVVEMTPDLLQAADPNLVSVLKKRIEQSFHSVLPNSKLSAAEEVKNGIRVSFEGGELDGEEREFRAAIVGVGRKPNSRIGGLEKTAVEIDERGFIKVDPQRRTADPNIYAIGDVAGEPMLAHKAMHEGRVAAEGISGQKVAYEPRAVPAIVYTDPEIAWCGLTETQAAEQKRPVQVLRFPWGASGRAITQGRADGLTKLLVDPESGYVLGMGIVGAGAGELISEGVLAIEMSARPEDIHLSIHPHPTLSETIMEAAQLFSGRGTHLYRAKKSRDAD
jgi:dihydrolipoamide dehydrogenase